MTTNTHPATPPTEPRHTIGSLVRKLATPERVAAAAGTIILIGSVIAALAVHSPRVFCSHVGGNSAPACPQPGTHLAIKAAIIIGGLIIAVLILVSTHVWQRRHR